MKLAWFNDNDEVWFWIFDETERYWQCWYEESDKIARRLLDIDCDDLTAVVQQIYRLTLEATH